MIISLNWLKKFTDIDMPVDELCTLIGARLVEIDEVIDQGAKYSNDLVVKVVECAKLEGSDHLSITKIDDGGIAKNVDRDEKGLVQVVCGAPNIAAGQLVAWLPPESIVPATFGKAESFVLGKRELRGIISNGMIASAKELDLFDEHDGILVLDKEIAPGTLFAEAYELNDYLLDIENKSLTHRPDCFGIVGFAREVAAITGTQFHTPDWLMTLKPNFEKVKNSEVELFVSIDNPELASRYQAIVMADADGNKQSPLQIQTYLSRSGIRPISAVVDVTNYLMLLTGQPLHAFDYDKLVAVGGDKADIHVRAGLDKEKLELLDGKKIELTTDDIVIAAGKTAIGLAGAMGGANTEIDEDTKRIIIEAASFNLFNLRATQMRHGIFSEAITRFTKGQPADLTAPVLFEAVRLMQDWSGARVISEIADTFPKPRQEISIETTSSAINDILGSSFNDEAILSTLHNVGLGAEKTDTNQLKVIVPYWRADIHIVEDISEEIGRLNGFDNIKPVLPTREFTATSQGEFDDFRNQIRKLLTRAGANEVLTYSFIHGNIMQKAGLDTNNSYVISNSISPDLEYYRQSLTPSLLDLVHPNIKQGFDKFALFELNKTESKASGLNDEGVPIESDMFAMAIASKSTSDSSQYYVAKRMLDFLCESLGLNLSYLPLESDMVEVIAMPFEYRRAAKLVDNNSGEIIGVVGEYKKLVSKGFKLPNKSAGFEIDCRKLFGLYDGINKKYTPISRFPSAERDICFQVISSTNFSQIVDSAKKALSATSLEYELKPVDIYQPENGSTKNITLRFKLTSQDHTLVGSEVSEILGLVCKSVIDQTHAVII